MIITTAFSHSLGYKCADKGEVLSFFLLNPAPSNYLVNLSTKYPSKNKVYLLNDAAGERKVETSDNFQNNLVSTRKSCYRSLAENRELQLKIWDSPRAISRNWYHCRVRESLTRSLALYKTEPERRRRRRKNPARSDSQWAIDPGHFWEIGIFNSTPAAEQQCAVVGVNDILPSHACCRFN